MPTYHRVYVCPVVIIPLRCYLLSGSQFRSTDGQWSAPPPLPPPPFPRSIESTDICWDDVNNDDDDGDDNVDGDGEDDDDDKDVDNNAVAIRSSDRSTNCHQSIQNPICQFSPICLFAKLKTNRLQFTRNNLSFGCNILPQCDCNMCTMNLSA